MLIEHNHIIINWLNSCYIRFSNMSQAGIDLDGIKRLEPTLKRCLTATDTNFILQDRLTVGEFSYLAERSDGQLSTYNTHKRYNDRYGHMETPPYADIIAMGIVDWKTGPLDKAIKAVIEEKTGYTIERGRVVRMPTPLDKFRGLFE